MSGNTDLVLYEIHEYQDGVHYTEALKDSPGPLSTFQQMMDVAVRDAEGRLFVWLREAI